MINDASTCKCAVLIFQSVSIFLWWLSAYGSVKCQYQTIYKTCCGKGLHRKSIQIKGICQYVYLPYLSVNVLSKFHSKISPFQILCYHMNYSFNLLTPMPPITGREERWPLFHFWRHHLWPNLASSKPKFCRRKRSFQRYPDQNDRLHKAWNMYENAQKFECIFQVPLSQSLWSGFHWKNLFLLQNLSTGDANFGQRW